MSQSEFTRPEFKISEIKVGERFRKDLGDIVGLARSIEKVGLLHPLVITPDGRLIDGLRRLEAFKTLKRTSIPVTIIDLEDILLGEYAANTYRKEFTVSEAVAISEAIKELERAQAKKRQRAGGRADGQASANFAEASRGETREKVAKAVGMSHTTLKKAKEVVEAAVEDPERYGPIKEEMDRSGKVDPAYRALKEAKAAEAPPVAEEPALAAGDPAPQAETPAHQVKETKADRRERLIKESGVEQMIMAARYVVKTFQNWFEVATTVEELKDIRDAVTKVADEVNRYFRCNFGITNTIRDIKKRIAEEKKKQASRDFMPITYLKAQPVACDPMPVGEEVQG